MKIKNINGALFAVALATVSAGFTSCEDEQTSMKLQAEPLPSIMFVLWMQPARTHCLLVHLSTIPSVLWVET